MFSQCKLKFLALLVVSHYLLLTPLCAQNKDVMFNDSVLDNPIENAFWFDSTVEVVNVAKYMQQTNSEAITLDNGYVEYLLSGQNRWLTIGYTVIPKQIDIVFTQYPKRKEDWITNYYELLANRLKALFTVDKNLNSTNIRWRLVMQTSCNNEEEAKQLFHGIVLKYSTVKMSSIETLPPLPVDYNQNYCLPSINYSTTNNLAVNTEVDNEELKNILYPESIKSADTEQYLPAKVKRPDEPECPTFKTRMEYPRRNLWQLLFGR